MTNKFELKLIEKRSLSSGTEHFSFKVDQAEIFEYKPGQFISLHIEKDGKEHRRNYSIANNPLQDNKIDIAMAYMPNGLASTLLENLQPGDNIHASGPYGQFILKDSVLPQRYILIGTGTGITPYRSMLPMLGEYLLTTNLEVVILQGVRSRADLLYGEEFIAFSKKFPRVTFRACYSRETELSDPTHEAIGYVQNQLADLNITAGADIAYLCGNPMMVDEAFQKLQDLGLDRAHIRREKYISSK